jgi:hypothetical protein
MSPPQPSYISMKRILPLLFLVLCLDMTNGQTPVNPIQKRYYEALFLIDGTNKPYYPSGAYNIMLDLASEGVPKAMNALAIMYAEGTGTEVNYSEAFYWFDRAASSGYYRAYYNLGLFWKYGYGVDRDESKALECYGKGADHGDPDCIYGLGYMSYKGIACDQDYEKALEKFFEAAALGNSASSYMIGICYKNGYGITRDESEARRWLELSAGLGNIRALAELFSDKAENNFNPDSLPSEIPEGIQIPETYKTVEHNLNGSDISGKFSGYLITYDWSGEYIISLAPLNLVLNYNETGFSGLWTESDSIIAEINASVTDTGLVFINSRYERYNHFHNKPVLFDFKSAEISITAIDSTVCLTGNIHLFSESTMEYEKPVFVSLVKNDAVGIHDITDETEKPVSDLCIFPNPFRDQINISFTLKTESDVSAMVYSIDGRKLHQADFGRLNSGENIQNLNLNLPGGIYIVKIICPSASVTTMIVK